MGTVRRCEPRQDLGLLDGHGRTRVRDRLPVQPADGQLHPVARHERNLAHEEPVRHDDPHRCQVQRRKDTDAEGREVQLRPSQDPDPPPERAVGDLRAQERSGRREHGRLHIRREAGIPAVRLLSLQHRDRSAARLQQVQQDGPHDRQPGCKTGRRDRSVRIPVRCELDVTDVRLAAPQRLVGDEAARSQARTAVRRRHSQLVEHGRTRQLPGGEHRPLQQLRPEVGDQGQASRRSTPRPRTTSERTRRGSSPTPRRSR